MATRVPAHRETTVLTIAAAPMAVTLTVITVTLLTLLMGCTPPTTAIPTPSPLPTVTTPAGGS